MRSIELSADLLVDVSGTSEGTQDKYYHQGIWYKTDTKGGEGKNEEIVSRLLEKSSLDPADYVRYEQIMINGKPGCACRDFTGEFDEYITIYRLYANTVGGDIARVLHGEDPEDSVRYVADFVERQTGLDIHRYLADTIALDQLTLNTDRHLNNLGIIFNAKTGIYRTAPIFDNGRAFFCGDKLYDESLGIRENRKHLIFRPFSASAELMAKVLEPWRTLTITKEAILETVSELSPGKERATLLFQLEDPAVSAIT